MSRNPGTWQSFLKDYFVFSKGQRRAVVLLVTLISLCIFLPAVNNYLQKTITAKADPILLQKVDSLKVYAVETDSYADDGGERPGFPPEENPAAFKGSVAARFIFDPNTASAVAWRNLGLRDKTITTIQNYLAKGGHFYKPDDLRKIYGLKKEEVESLLPFVRIAEKEISGKANGPAKSWSAPKAETGKPLIIDINLADTSDYKRLPGIGSKLSARIVNYRNKLGGFYQVAQVGETYGVPDSTFQKIKPMLVLTVGPQKRNINTCSTDSLRTPYIPFNVANAIVQYRTHNGKFNSLEDLRKIPLIDEALFLKITPYLTVE